MTLAENFSDIISYIGFILSNSVRNTSTLTEYIERGEKIVKSGNYPISNMKKVDEFIRNPDDFFEKN